MRPLEQDQIRLDISSPTLSVLLCVNRSNPHLACAINSVLTQNDGEFEFLIAANNCDDALISELYSLVSGDPRVRLFRTTIGQLAFNLNFLADQAKGEYLVRMDADDVSEPSRVRVLRHAIATSRPDVIGSWARLIDGDDRPLGDLKLPTECADIEKRLPIGTVFCHPTVAIRKEFLLSMRGYLGGFVSEDTDLWIRAVRSGATLMNIPEYLLRYRLHPEQASATRRGYAEVAAHWLRELLTKPDFYAARGLTIALAKCVFSSLLLLRHQAKIRSRIKA